ncbi:MAG: hypothetical protein ACPL4I_12755 [Bacteroidota bacterium]
MKKNMKVFLVAVATFALIVLLATPALRFAEINVPWVNPGPEGVNLYIDGLQLPWTSNIFKLQDYGPNQLIYSSGNTQVSDWYWAGYQPATKRVSVSRVSAGNPKSIVLNKLWPEGGESGNLRVEVMRPEIDLGVGTSGLDARGVVPAGFSAGQIKSIEYCYLQKEWSDTVNGKSVTYQQWNKTVVNIVPVDLVIQFSVVPGGHRDIGWKNTVIWFCMDFTVWQDVMKDYNPPTGTGWQLQAFDQRGGFPIFAWISGWDAWVDQAGEQSTVYQKRHNANEDLGQTANLPSDVAEDKYVSVDPGFVGREIALLSDDPSKSPNPGTYRVLLTKDVLEQAAAGNTLDQVIAANVLPKIPRGFSPTVWFAITLVNYGPYSRDNTAWYNPWKWSDYDTWYPASYMRIRVLYATWGNFVYLWTKEEAQQQNYQFDNRTLEYQKEGGPDPLTAFLKGVADWWNGAMVWLGNPFNQLWLFFIIIVIVIIVVSIASPGVWTAVAASRKKA